ncbi:MAG: hypothetical protein JWO78_1985 [Micavibrio sp.]|nr:hypothetical protein [Micavibrio sp.]
MTECTAFIGEQMIASGTLPGVAKATRMAMDRNPKATVLVFDDHTGQPVEIDFRGSVDDVLGRLAPDSANDTGDSPNKSRGPGRPKLGVVAREVTLLPRHWDWLGQQPGGASVALRKLVETARRENENKGGIRERREAVYRFMSAMAGNLPGFEEAIRALFAGDQISFLNQMDSWPHDMRVYTKRIAEDAF